MAKRQSAKSAKVSTSTAHQTITKPSSAKKTASKTTASKKAAGTKPTTKKGEAKQSPAKASDKPGSKKVAAGSTVKSAKATGKVGGKPVAKKTPLPKKPSTKKTASKGTTVVSKTSSKASSKKTGPKKSSVAAVSAKKAAAKKSTVAGVSAKKAVAKKSTVAGVSAKKTAPRKAGRVATVGATAPSFELPSQSGTLVSSTEFAGKAYVLYFYPKDHTPGCTKEACGFRDEMAQFKNASVDVVGVSPDSTGRHQKFAEKYGLPFTLLADTDKELAQAYGVWTLKKNYGREYMGIERSTFLIGRDGKVAREWRGVKVGGHVEAVLEAARAL